MGLDWTASSIAAAVHDGRCAPLALCDHVDARIDRVEPDIGAFLERCADHARDSARGVDQRVPGERPTLAGVPIALKDNICTTFAKTTCASRILADYRSPYDATVVDRLLRAGALIVGKTNLDEFAMGSSNENSGFHPTRNPWRPDCVPGGSSGGSVAAVASGMVPVALGSDTGGSIRLPAAFCGVVGLKPSYGRVSRYGLVAYGSSLDQIGPIARDVTDVAMVLQVIAGRDERDATSVDEPVPDYRRALEDAALAGCAKTLRIGLPRAYFGDGLHPEVRAAIEAAVEVYRARGATVVEVDMPHAQHVVAVYYLIATAEASSNLARYDGVHYGHRTKSPQNLVDLYAQSRADGFGAEVKRRIMLGTFALSSGYYDAYYDKALRARRLVKDDFDRAFEQVDVLLGPTAPTPAFRFGEKTADPLQMYLADVYTISANLAGVPAISIPCGLSAEGLPIGLQLMGPLFSEERLLQVARLFEQETDWHQRRPPIWAGDGE